jgi:hypothetical protein
MKLLAVLLSFLLTSIAAPTNKKDLLDGKTTNSEHSKNAVTEAEKWDQGPYPPPVSAIKILQAHCVLTNNGYYT